MIKLNYYSHLLLNSKYSLLIKLTLIFIIYTLFYLENTNDIVSCAPTKKHLIEKIETLKTENIILKNELNRFRMSVDTRLYQQNTIETLDSLKQKIEAYREINAIGFLTIEERMPETLIKHNGVDRADLTFLKRHSEYITLPKNMPLLYNMNKVNILSIETLPCGKEITSLYRNFSYEGAEKITPVSCAWPFYDYTEYMEDIYYPANHPDNNYNPEAKRLYKVIGRQFHSKNMVTQLIQNCNIS